MSSTQSIAEAARKGKKTVKVAEVVRSGTQQTLPEGWSLDDGIKNLERIKKYEEERVAINMPVPFLPADVAYHLPIVMEEMFGAVFMETVKTFFGEVPPSSIRVPISSSETANVPWGRITLPGGDPSLEHLQMDLDWSLGYATFCLAGEIRRKFQPVVEQLIAKLEARLNEKSLYRGKAVRVAFTDDEDDQHPFVTPEFLDVSHIEPEDLVYSRDLEMEIGANLLSLVKYPEAVKSMSGGRLKRGALLSGQYGTGKTLLALLAAKLATTEGGFTFLYLTKASDLPLAIKFAQRYGRTVVYAEDIDQFMSGNRDHFMNTILNTLDGIDTKHQELVTILTTNHVSHINKAMLRPGRIDTCITITPPDAEAVTRLIRRVAGTMVDASEDLTKVGEILQGQIPAVISEVIQRAKLHAIWRTDGTSVDSLTSSDLEFAANELLRQRNALKEPNPERPDPMHQFGTGVGKEIGDRLVEVFDKKPTNGLARVN